MTPRTAFKICFGVNLHFTSEKYSLIKYGNETSAANSKFDSLTENQRYRFIWLSEKFASNTDLMYASIGCQFDDISIQHDIKSDVYDSYIKFKARREAMTYHLKSEFSKYESIKGKSLDKLIFKYFVSELSPEFILCLAKDNELENLYTNNNFTWARQKILKLIKYRDFFNISKYRPVLDDLCYNLSYQQ